MKPKVDFCFKELMDDDEVRRGVIAAVLNLPPEKIEKTILLPTHLRSLRNQIVTYRKPVLIVHGTKDKLVDISADEQKRLEYEEREKALRDRSILIITGMEEGIKQGKKEGLKLAREILRLYRAGISPEQIAKECGVSVEEVKEILE